MGDKIEKVKREAKKDAEKAAVALAQAGALSGMVSGGPVECVVGVVVGGYWWSLGSSTRISLQVAQSLCYISRYVVQQSL